MSMTSDEWFMAAVEAERLDAIEKEYAMRIEAAARTWRAQWPLACPSCRGWGGFNCHQSHPYGSTYAVETLFDPCTDQHDEQCHRCGEPGLKPDAIGPCFVCGWDYDDGDPACSI